MVSPPTANRKSRSRLASSKASTTKSASSRDEPTDCATTNISASRFSPACCRRYDPSKSPTRFPEDPIYRCPTNGLKVQGWFADAPADEGETYETVTCLACNGLHLINRRTGRTLGSDDE